MQNIASEQWDESDERNPTNTSNGNQREQSGHLLAQENIAEAIGKVLPEAGAVVAGLRIGVVDLGQNKNHRQKADAVQQKICRLAQPCHHQASDGGSDKARKIELCRVERNRVGEIFFRDEPRHQCLLAGRVQRCGQTTGEGQQDDFRNLNLVGKGQNCHDESTDHHGCLRA